MSGTSDFQLKSLVAAFHLKHRFLGVFDNSFPGFINPNVASSAIINTGSRQSGGMHWIAFAYDPSLRRCYMFDPFGWSDSKLWTIYKFKYDRLLKRTGLSQNDRCITLIKSTQAVQCMCSAACGLFSALFIASFDKYPSKPMDGNNIIDILVGVDHSKMNLPEYIDILHRNQERMYTWFEFNNNYFRYNSIKLRKETAIESINDVHMH